jgi:undecaprenyl diphosphate synthase
MFFRHKQKINPEKLPQHIAFIIDGNGRWAKSRGLPRSFGHKMGVEALFRTIKECSRLGIKYATFFTFSTENWARPKEEIDALFSLVRDRIADSEKLFMQNNLILRHMGNLEPLPADLVDALKKLEEKTSQNNGMVVNLAINYGARQEIVRAVNMAIKEGKEVDEKSFENYLYSASLPSPDLLIRTSGELRLSNFMLYQVAYTEFYFPKLHWPAFDRKALEEAIISYQSRSRRFGKTDEQIAKN